MQDKEHIQEEDNKWKAAEKWAEEKLEEYRQINGEEEKQAFLDMIAYDKNYYQVDENGNGKYIGPFPPMKDRHPGTGEELDLIN